MLRNPVILVIAGIEFCSGFLRSALMDWYAIFKTQTHLDNFIAGNWGMVQCCAGILGGVVAGVISDHVFQSRRGPMASILYGAMLGGSIVMWLTLENGLVMSLVATVMMLSIIGVHGMLSGAASMDFGGKQNVGIVVGIIDGLVYLGQGVQYLTLGHMVPTGEAAATASNWAIWPLMMIPASILGLALGSRIWNAKPAGKGAAAH
jgi:OPA family glycerol-3-phosphate transporter-like MFS transporter